VYWRRSPCGSCCSAWRQRCSACCTTAGSAVSRSGARGASSSQTSGALRPVPRWSISTMSRRFEKRPSRRPTGPASEMALCPGPPAKKNTASGRLWRDSAGNTA
jgi:hypothetical protein